MEWIYFIIVLAVGLVAWLKFDEFKLNEKKARALKISDIDNMRGAEFEIYVATLLRHQGFIVTTTPASGDLGVDLVAHKSNVKHSIQVKRQQGRVSRRAVSDAVGGKAHYGCTEAMVITNSYFTDGAIQLARSNKCRLVDRVELTRWIIAYQEKRPI